MRNGKRTSEGRWGIRRAPRFHGKSSRTSAALALTAALIVSAVLGGCGDGKKSPEYLEPEGSDAVIVVHPMWNEEFDVSLDGQFLGRISWVQPYCVVSGRHILVADGGSLEFTIRPGQTLNVALRHTGGSYWDEDLHEWRTEGGGTEVRIFEP
jgi:hypothetical protein